MTDSEQLMTVAAWIDKMFPNDPGPEVQTDLRRIAIKLLDLEAELARVKEAAEVLAKHIVSLEDHSADLGEVTDYKSASNNTKQRHAENVNRVNETDAAVLANPTASALVEQARKESL